jgi:hypothetical protein
MSEVDEAIETIIIDKAKRIIDSNGHTEHIKKFLDDLCGINSDDTPVDVFKICAVDAMIYDVGAALNFAEFKDPDKRIEILKKLFPKK